MEAAPSVTTCSQCGSLNDSGSGKCAACGADVPARTSIVTQPAFELFFRARGSDRAPRPSWMRPFGALAAAGKTAGAISLAPGAAFRSFRMEGGLALPLVYSVLVGGPFILLSTLWKAAGGHLVFLLVFLAPPLYLYLRAQALHLTLVLTGRATQPFEVTCRVVAYSNASVAPLLALPLVGDFLFLVAGTLIETTGIRICHSMSVKDAVIAEVIPALVLCLAFVAGTFLGLLWWSPTSA